MGRFTLARQGVHQESILETGPGKQGKREKASQCHVDRKELAQRAEKIRKDCTANNQLSITKVLE